MDVFISVSPYLKTLSMVASTKLLHLLEAFSTPWFLFSSPTNHHLVFFLLEIFNNIIQYQFDGKLLEQTKAQTLILPVILRIGNSNLVYTIIRKRQVFHSLANLPCDYGTIAKSLNKRVKRHLPKAVSSESIAELAMEGSHPALPAEPGTLKATLPDTPAITQMTERESAHPSFQQAEQVAITNGVANLSVNTKGASGNDGSGDSLFNPVSVIVCSNRLRFLRNLEIMKLTCSKLTFTLQSRITFK